MAGRKRSRSFAITFNHINWSKTAFGDYLTAANIIKSYCCAEESHHPALDPETGKIMNVQTSKHHHIYLETQEKYFLTEIKDIVDLFIGNEPLSYDIQEITNLKTDWLF
jgi:hypothetical protein